ncbi:MAG: hypothetical protein GW815_03295 [Candidatus Moranbacteria bacterium]|nr:hypothetical protein [Candidatus Moranbacteria bacterium]OIQ03241.1 MAG: hypothetical protein AUK58_01930 [Candidatus Moranbacteria bacterium CG2_30_41_165]PIP25874.1 MAG: hypothetical protein COX32_01055 [Candidatus Moranbacteria bacterium CG23_combo_of_CG06-09_8_20_14_all_41_28]PIV86617.1 MAG: hypothetical protein COW50_00380 [Candidatus Moranbacteria bacterium CG17_big_fil_post_rev_8_21_14_2_50_41_107]PIW93985.1 MAG: hypothetical protein COZ86_03405 [Candidatus Moranbacteria bacterium CG_
MSEELKSVTRNVMERIHHEKITMRPRIYFIFGSVLTFIGLTASILTSVFLFSLLRFSLRSHGPMGAYRWEQLVSNFPWWALFVALFGLILGIWLLRRYEFSYKMNFRVIALGFILAIIATGFVLDMTGLSDVLSRQGPMKGIMRPSSSDDMFRPGSSFGGFYNK